MGWGRTIFCFGWNELLSFGYEVYVRLVLSICSVCAHMVPRGDIT